MSQLTFRKYQEGDEKGLSELHKAVFGVARDTAFWKWKYENNPAGDDVMYLALNGEKIIGGDGVIPVNLKVGKRQIKAGQIVDTIISPEYRRGSPLFRLQNLIINEVKRRSFELCYGFSIEITLRISIKTLKFHEVCPVSRLVCVLDAAPFLGEKLKNRFLGDILAGVRNTAVRWHRGWGEFNLPEGLKLRKITRFDERFEQFFWKEIADDYEVMTVRDPQYLNWRYIDITNVEYDVFALETTVSNSHEDPELAGRIQGFVVLTCLENEKRGRIVDILVPRGKSEVAELLVDFSLRYFLERGMDVVACWMLDHSPVYQLLQTKGFVTRPGKRYLIVRFRDPDISMGSVLDKTNWYITLGDCDNY